MVGGELRKEAAGSTAASSVTSGNTPPNRREEGADGEQILGRAAESSQARGAMARREWDVWAGLRGGAGRVGWRDRARRDESGGIG